MLQWLVVFLSILPGLLDLASPIAAQAIFALTAMGKQSQLVYGRNNTHTFINHSSRSIIHRPYLLQGTSLCSCSPYCRPSLTTSSNYPALIPEPPRGALQARPILPGLRSAWLGSEQHVHPLDTLRGSHPRTPNNHARNSTEHELRVSRNSCLFCFLRSSVLGDCRSVITVGVMFCSLLWYFLGARKHYKGPTGMLSHIITHPVVVY